MQRRPKNRTNYNGRFDEGEAHRVSSGAVFGVSATVVACAGSGALLGVLLGGTTVGFPIAIASTIVGAIGGAILGRYVDTNA